MPRARNRLRKALQSGRSDNVDADRKLGVVHNGLALCLAYCIEVMQSPDTFDDYRFDE